MDKQRDEQIETEMDVHMDGCKTKDRWKEW